ncbi:MAG: hypothetical protein K9G05_05500 [Candidatus Nanopelagicales bacterium]|nr:hypothetical protein [Candidatus Nanopelagicales bacterium]MCF8551519.1 hypothetical protein [Candidatus Nanopelagicales bacterium]
MKRFLVTVATVLAGIAVVAGIGVFNSVAQEEPAPITAEFDGTMVDTPQGKLPHATLALSVYPNSSASVPPPKTSSAYEANWLSGQPFYSPSTSIQVPANSVVTITFTQYDTGGQIYNPYFARVHGSLDGTMTWNGDTVKGLKHDEVAHTFTVHQYAETSQESFFLSVPLPQNKANAKADKEGYPVDPQVVTVTFVTGDAGTYVWNCEFPCGDLYQEFSGPMQTRGWMAGTFEVVA